MLYAKYIIIIRIYWSEKGRNGGVQAQKTNIYYYLIIFSCDTIQINKIFRYIKCLIITREIFVEK